jgi:hypothetical protein
MSYKSPSFQDRIGAAAEARQKALDRLRARPAVDEARLEERRAAAAAREDAAAEKRTAKLAARAQAEAEKGAAGEAAAKAAALAQPKSESELKAARDARYAARRKRK